MKKSELRTILFYVYIVLIELRYYFNRISIFDNNSNIDKSIFFSSLFFLALYICINEYTKKKLIECVIFLIIGGLSYYFGNITNFLIIILTIIFMPKNNIKNVLDVIFIERLILLLILVCMVKFGVVENKAFIITKGIGKSVVGYSFGESHPNILAIDICSLGMLWMCIKNKKVSKVSCLILFITGVTEYIITKSRMSTVLYFLFMLLWILQNKKSIRNIIFKFSTHIFTIVMILNYGLMLLYYLFSSRLSFINWINNSVFNGRIGLALIYFTNLKPTIFGENVDPSIFSNKYSYYAIDNGYVNMLFLYGISGILIIAYLYRCAIKRMKEMQCYTYILSLIIFCIWMSYEANLISMEFNFSLILLCMAFYSENRNEVKGLNIRLE